MYPDHDCVYLGSDWETGPHQCTYLSSPLAHPTPLFGDRVAVISLCHMKLIEISSNITHYVQYCNYIKVLDCTV